MAKRIGDILIDLGFIDQDQLEMALTESKKTEIMLGDVLLRLDWVTQEQLQMSLAVQSGAKLLDTDAIKVDPGLIAQVLPSHKRTMGVSVHSLVRRIPMALGHIVGGSRRADRRCV